MKFHKTCQNLPTVIMTSKVNENPGSLMIMLFGLPTLEKVSGTGIAFPISVVTINLVMEDDWQKELSPFNISSFGNKVHRNLRGKVKGRVTNNSRSVKNQEAPLTHNWCSNLLLSKPRSHKL